MKKLTNIEFINKAILRHNNKYDYSLTNYCGSKEKTIIICKEHGEFFQSPNAHLRGNCCPKCARISQSNKRTKNTNDAINEFKQINGNKYDYSLVDYKNALIKVKIVCKEHGIFEQKPNSHLRGDGCPKCRLINLKYTIEEFTTKANLIHNNKYDYSLTEYKRVDIKIKIICPDHGIFEQIPNSHLNGKGCSLCSESKGERKIRELLMKNEISFIQEHKFDDCRDIHTLLFDFYLPNLNVCIEYDGEHHFKAIKGWGGDKGLINRQNKDNIKDNYCLDNNIKLIRIRYDEDIDKKLKSSITTIETNSINSY